MNGCCMQINLNLKKNYTCCTQLRLFSYVPYLLIGIKRLSLSGSLLCYITVCEIICGGFFCGYFSVSVSLITELLRCCFSSTLTSLRLSVKVLSFDVLLQGFSVDRMGVLELDIIQQNVCLFISI